MLMLLNCRIFFSKIIQLSLFVYVNYVYRDDKLNDYRQNIAYFALFFVKKQTIIKLVCYLWGCSTGTYNRLYDSKVGCKSPGIGDKKHKKALENAGLVTSP